MLPSLVTAIIAFINSITAYHLSNVSHKKISYYLSFILFIVALILIFQEYTKSNNKPALNVFTVKLPDGVKPPKRMIWFELQNEGSSALEDVKTSLFDMKSTMSEMKKKVDSLKEVGKKEIIESSSTVKLVGTIPGNNSAEIYRVNMDETLIQDGAQFQVMVNWNNNSMLYNFELRESKGVITLSHPQVRSRNDLLDGTKLFRFYSDHGIGQGHELKQQGVVFN